MQKGMEFDQELADLWGWLVGGQVENIGKTFGATVTVIYYPCYNSVTVASYRL